MSQALSETVSYVNRARAFMPAGTVPPFVMRFDAGSVPVGYLAFASNTKSVGQIQDLALNTVRPLFATLQGVSAPPPFGGSPRTIVVAVEPDRLQAYHLSAQDVVSAIASAEVISPSGNINLDGKYPVVPINSIVRDVNDLAGVAVRAGSFPTVFVRDVAHVSDASDVPTSIALVDGKPTVYIPVTKRADASTLSVVGLVRENLPKFQAALPDDVSVRYVFDQSPFVTNAITSLTIEGILGAVLAGVMVLLFLRDWRSALIVVVNIPLSLLAALLALWLTGQTINIMTLGGLVLAVGILVDMSTVAIENIHTHLMRKQGAERAVLDSGSEVAVPLLIAMLCVVAVFLPSFAMQGTAKALFIPLSLAVGFSMIASYLLANTLVPILSVWAFRSRHSARELSQSEPGFFARLQRRYARGLEQLVARRGLIVVAYLSSSVVLIALVFPRLGTDIFPRVESRQLQLRIRAPSGTQLGLTEADTQKALNIVGQEAGSDSIELSLALIGVHGSAYPINFIYLWNSGPQESVLQVQLKNAVRVNAAVLRERLRQRFAREMPEVQFSFEPADIISRVMSFGASTPIEVAVSGANLANDRMFAENVRSKLKGLSILRDVQFGQPLDYPAVNVVVDRERAGVLGITANDLARSLAPETSSSRFTQPIYWAGATGVAYQVQVQVPQLLVTSVEDLRNVSVSGEKATTLLRNVANVQQGNVVGEYDRYNMTRMVTVTANIEGADLGSAAAAVRGSLAQLGNPPAKVSVSLRGQVQPMEQLLIGLRTGMLLSVLVIFLLLVANFQSWQLALVTIASVPAVVLGVSLALWLTRSTLNLESFMGAIMSVGVAVANAILLVSFAERIRMTGRSAQEAAIEGARSRLRPILMTSLAMIAGMLPMALGLGESGQQTAPLGRAVIGGLAFATLATLLVLPAVFTMVRAGAGRASPSLDPDDPSTIAQEH
jgi:multidrug efflux pump subunit AcrB